MFYHRSFRNLQYLQKPFRSNFKHTRVFKYQNRYIFSKDSKRTTDDGIPKVGPLPVLIGLIVAAIPIAGVVYLNRMDKESKDSLRTRFQNIAQKLTGSVQKVATAPTEKIRKYVREKTAEPGVHDLDSEIESKSDENRITGEKVLKSITEKVEQLKQEKKD